MAGFPLGMGIVLLYLGLFSYIIDVYLTYTASALAAAVMVRSIFGAVFPLFANQMFEKLKKCLMFLVSYVFDPCGSCCSLLGTDAG